jgi:PucR family transcriptional regulator, purine catabolism regulatory protein
MNPAGITISDLLRLPVLKDAKVISGEKGLDRIVWYIDIMEVPDVKGWLREGELLLTTAYAIRDDPALLPKLVQLLAQAGAAALAIKPEKYIQDMPVEMIQISNDFNLPIIQLPTRAAYIDIIQAVMEQIIDKQASLLRRSEEIYKKLTTLVLENSGIQAVADNIGILLESQIWLLDKTGEAIVSSPQGAAYIPSPDIRYWDITVDKQMVGKLIIEKELLDEMDMVCIEQARLVFSLELMRRKTALDTERNLRGDFIEELLTGLPLSQQEVVNKGRQLGLTPESAWEIVIIEGEDIMDEDIPMRRQLGGLLKQEYQQHSNKSHIHKQGNRLVLMLSSPYQLYLPRVNVKTWNEILTPLFRQFKGLRVGYGDKYLLWEVQRSYLEAKKAIMIGSSLDKTQQVFMFEEIELFNLLLEASESVNMDKAVERKIGKLWQYDRENETDFVKTLFYYLSSDGSLVETAKHLFIHRNSVKYRMDRIEEIADIKIDSFRQKFVYFLCIFYHLFKTTT